MVNLLKENGILVSDVSSQLGDGFIRVLIGLPEDNDAFINISSTIIRH